MTANLLDLKWLLAGSPRLFESRGIGQPSRGLDLKWLAGSPRPVGDRGVIVYLLDVNMLLALSDSMHVHHDGAHQWFTARGQTAWATCPITENGFVRIASHSSYPNRPGDVAVVLSMLRQFCATPGHHFWAANMSIRTMLQSGIIINHSQITDLYLLGLAVQHGGKLATFDQRISTTAVQGGDEALELIIP